MKIEVKNRKDNNNCRNTAGHEPTHVHEFTSV